MKKTISTIAVLLILNACATSSTSTSGSKPEQTQAPQTQAVVTTTKVANKKTISPKAPSGPVLTKAQAEARVAAGATVFDARPAEEFEAIHSGKVTSVINVPYALLGATLPALESYRAKEILILGQTDAQVEAMRIEMGAAGFKKVLNAFSLGAGK